MTAATLRARPDAGGILSVALGACELSVSALLRVEVDRRPTGRWADPAVCADGDLLAVEGMLDGAPLGARWSAPPWTWPWNVWGCAPRRGTCRTS